MFCKRFFAVLTALCLVFSMVPVHSHADHTHALTSTVHNHQERLATHSIRRGSNDSYYISPSREAVLPAGESEYVVSGVYQDVCQWGISQNGYLYIWCDTDMPAGNASGDYPWYAYKALFNQVYIDAKSVAAHAFSGYTDLYTAEFAVSLERIEEQAFSDCNQLGQLWFYGNAPIVGSNAFGGVSAVLLCHYGNTSWDSLWGSSFGGALEWQYWVNSLNGGMYDSIEWYVYEDMSLSLFGIGGPMRSQTSAEGYPWGPYLQELTYLEIEQISDLGNYAFAGARKVTDFSWDSCLTSIGDYAFSGTNASSLRVTGSVTHVGDWAFSDCAALTMVLFGENVRYLDSGAFADCAALDELVFEGDPPVIAEDAFRNVAATATYPDTGTWTRDHFLHYGGNLSWGPYTYDVDGGTFSGIRWAVTNTGVLRLEGSAGVMENLSDASLYPWAAYANDIQYVQCTGVTHLGSHCFKNFTALVTVSFDSQLASIGDGAFQGCDQFVMSFSGSIPSTGSEVFTSRDIRLEYPESDPTWTEQAISEFFGYIPGENELPPIDFPSGIDCGITAQEVYDAIISLKVLYPEGMGWTNEDFYAWDGGIYSGGYGCAGFAFLLSDRAFGDEPARIIDEDITIDDVRVGDILRINNDTHSVIVLEVHEDHIVIAEGNYNLSIHWGRTLSAATVASVTDYIMTRYPLHSWNTHSCLEDRACSVCGLQETAPGHSWQDATCAAAKTCKVCGATEGTPTDQHVFSSAADNDCDVCGYRRDVGTELPDDVFDPFSAFELEVLRLTNLERLKEGLDPLTTTEIHQQAAHIRAEEVLSLFSHDRPNGTDCFTVLDELGIDYWSAAENIAKGQGNPAAVVNAWMNSPGHRNNILNPRLGHMGVGEKNRAWVQIFTDAGRYTSIRVDVSGTLSVKPGTDIDSMGLVAVLNSEDGICWLPLAGAYCSGYDPNQAGEQTVTVSVLGVTCTFTVTVEAHKHAWTEATCDTPKTCSVCGKAEGAPLGHDWQSATCETPKTCVRCGETEGTPLDHDWTEATCETARTCAACGETEGNPLGHSWTDANCENPKTCDRCGLTEGTALGHTWKEATCDTPKTCSVCGETDGNPLGHNWKAADCAHPSTCARCAATRGAPLGHAWQEATCETPKTCGRCGLTEGTVAAHSWDEGTVTTEPTYDQSGEITYTCTHCGAVRTEEVPNLLPLFTKVEKPDTIAEAHGLSYEVPESGATVLIFFSSSCGNSQFLMRQLNTCSWMANPYLNVIAVETNAGTEEAMQEFRDTYTPDVKDHIRYLYTADDSILFDYCRLFASGNSLTWPLVLIVTDSEQGPMIRYGAEAVTDETALEAALRQVSPAFAGWDGTVHEHTWSEATCEAPKTCSLCGETDGEPLGHDFRDGSCTRCGKDDGTQLVRGDADGDGKVTYLDAMEVLRCAVGLVNLDADVRAACDVDNDNEITYLDAMEILRFAVGLVTEFPPRP